MSVRSLRSLDEGDRFRLRFNPFEKGCGKVWRIIRMNEEMCECHLEGKPNKIMHVQMNRQVICVD